MRVVCEIQQLVSVEIENVTVAILQDRIILTGKKKGQVFAVGTDIGHDGPGIREYFC